MTPLLKDQQVTCPTTGKVWSVGDLVSIWTTPGLFSKDSVQVSAPIESFYRTHGRSRNPGDTLYANAAHTTAGCRFLHADKLCDLISATPRNPRI